MTTGPRCGWIQVFLDFHSTIQPDGPTAEAFEIGAGIVGDRERFGKLRPMPRNVMAELGSPKRILLNPDFAEAFSEPTSTANI
jgi:hypothetical protein